MNALLSGGIVVCAYVAGRWALGESLASGLRRSVLARGALALILGISITTPILVVVAAAGLFDIRTLGLVGWIAAALGVARRPLKVPRWPVLDLSETLVLVIVVVFAIAAVTGRDETLGVGRDQQVYAESAVALSERGHAWAFYAPIDEADERLLRSTGGLNILGLSRMRNGIDQPIRTTHSLGWPVWLALAHFGFGIDGLYAANAIVFAFGGVLFFLLLRRSVASGIAVAATCLFLSLPSSLWIAGISLSEPLAMTLLLAVPLFGSAGMNRARWRIAVLLLAATLVRIDSALLIPAVLAASALAATSSWAQATESRRRFAVAQVFALATALLAYLAFYPGYLRSVLPEIAAIVAATLGLALMVVFLTPRMAFNVRRIIDGRSSRLAAIVALVMLFVYAVALRPMHPPFSIIRQASGLNGQRDFREESLLNLATYVSWPILLLAVGGVCYAIQVKWAARRGLFRSLLLVLGIGPALLYLWSPQVSPDHPWAVRRFVPTIIPYVVLFAALFVHVVTRRFGRVGTTAGALVLAAPYALIVSKYPPQLTLMRENQGMTSQLVSIANELPPGLVVDVGADENVASALFVAFGKPVVIVPSGVKNKASIGRVTTWIQAKSALGRPAWLLHGPQLWRTGVEISDQREWSIARKYLTPSNEPPVTSATTARTQLVLSRIDRLDPTFATRMFGGERIWGTRDGGFFESEVAPFGQFRYTDGHAWIEVPAQALRGAQALKIDVFSYARQGVTRWIAVLIDGRPVWTGDVGPGVSTLRVPVSGVVDGDVARIEILSQAVAPAEMNADDPRVDLSIGLIGIRPLHAGEPRESGSGIQGFRSHLALIGASPEPQRISTGHTADFVLDVTNSGTEFWPSVRELGGPERAVQIALRWYRRGKPDAFVGDNRWSLSVSMLPGDRTRLQVPLAPIGLDGKSLPPGEYDVHVGMVRETVALFADNGDAVLSIPVVVAQ